MKAIFALQNSRFPSPPFALPIQFASTPAYQGGCSMGPLPGVILLLSALRLGKE